MKTYLYLSLFVSVLAFYSCLANPLCNCGNDGICNNDGSCTCLNGTLGDKCHYKIASVTCENHIATYQFYFPPNFAGTVFVDGDNEYDDVVPYCDVMKTFIATSNGLINFELIVNLNEIPDVHNCAHFVHRDISTYTLDFIVKDQESDPGRTVSLKCISEE